MSNKLKKFDILKEYYKNLSTSLQAHINTLIISFHQDKLLSESEVVTISKQDQQESKVTDILNIIVKRVGNNDSDDIFDKLISFMKDSQDLSLLELANKLANNQQDIDYAYGIPVQPVQTESGPSSPPTECEKQQFIQTDQVTQSNEVTQELVTNTTPKFSQRPPHNEANNKSSDAFNESQFLTAVIQREEKRNGLLKIRFSTVLCLGLPRTGKTSFCNLVMKKSTQIVSPGNSYTIFLKKYGLMVPGEESQWMEINPEKLTESIDQISKKDKQPGILDILLLLDCNIPTSALSLLQPSVVTFVVYKMIGKKFSFSDSYDFIQSKNNFPKFVKELLSCSCVKKNIKYSELEITESDRMSYTAFVGVLDGSSSKKSYEKEAAVVNKSLSIVKEHINCPLDEFPLPFWYVRDAAEDDDDDDGVDEDDNDTYLHLVNLADQNEQNVEKLRNSLDDVITYNSGHKLPITWIILFFNVYKLCLEKGRSYLYFSDVLKLWVGEYNGYNSENELKIALHFFHHVGVLFYFDMVEGLEDYVFTDCLWIFDKLNYLLFHYKDSKYDLNAKRVLKYEGQLQSRMIKQIKFEGPGEMKLQTFINLLKHLNYVAPLQQNNYFMPSILESHECNPGIFKQYGSPLSLPMLVTFSSGSLHRSVFCFLAAYIMNNLPEKWSKVKYKKQQQHTFKDLITFSIDVGQYVCIIDKVFFLEVRIYSKATTSNGNINLHNHVYKFIQIALHKICKELQLSHDDCRYGFLCTCKVDKDVVDHIMVVKGSKDDEYACCCKGNDSRELSYNHTVWLLERSIGASCVQEQGIEESENTGGVMVEQDSKHGIASSPVGERFENLIMVKSTDRPTLKYLHRFKNDICKHWYDLGVQLLHDDDAAKLDNIQANFKDVDQCCSRMFKIWLDTSSSATWNDLIYALKVIELRDLATKIDGALATFPEQDSHNHSVQPDHPNKESRDYPDGPMEVQSTENLSQESDSTSNTVVEDYRMNAQLMINSSKAATLPRQKSMDCSSILGDTEKPAISSTCMPAPLYTYDQKEKLPRVNLLLRLRSLSEGDTPNGGPLVLDNAAEHNKKKSSDTVDE